MLRNLLLLGAFCLSILPSCSPPERTKDAATETVRNTSHAESFTRETYDKLLVADAHGEALPKQVFSVTVTITNVSANRQEKGTDISLKGTLWPGSKVEGKFIFAQSEFEYVAARKPGEVVTLKCQLDGISSNTASFMGAIASSEQNLTHKKEG